MTQTRLDHWARDGHRANVQIDGGANMANDDDQVASRTEGSCAADLADQQEGIGPLSR